MYFEDADVAIQLFSSIWYIIYLVVSIRKRLLLLTLNILKGVNHNDGAYTRRAKLVSAWSRCRRRPNDGSGIAPTVYYLLLL